MTNEIPAEVWRNRDAFARRHNYDLDARVTELQAMERHPLTAVIDRSDRPARARQATVDGDAPKPSA